MAYNSKVAQQIQSLLDNRIPLSNAFNIAGVSASEQVYYTVNNTGTVIQSNLPLPPTLQSNAIQEEILATETRIESLQNQLDNTTKISTQRQLAVQIQQQERALANYKESLEEANQKVAAQTTVDSAALNAQIAAQTELNDAAAAFRDQEAQSFAPEPVNEDAVQNSDNFFPENVQYGPASVNPDDVPGGEEQETAIDQNDADTGDAMAALAKEAQQQNTIQQRLNQNLQGDWRVKLALLPEANYLYKDRSNSILAPLAETDGVIFPYTPVIRANYQARYDPIDLTHSNYRGYFYKNSSVDNVGITCTFTAQSTKEAQYLLAVIHFFRSVTKMFYGQDARRGTPPPLVTLTGLGEFQFNNHPCVVTSFSYDLPNVVDYIRVDPSNQQLSIAARSTRKSVTGFEAIDAVLNRLETIYDQRKNPLSRTGKSEDLGYTSSVVNNTKMTTYVPTKMEINITLLPIQTRQQVSQEFSLEKFANGDLLRKGFW